MTQEKVLEKLGKIKAHMESAKEIGNEAEAQAFAAMLQNLLLKHKLEMTDVQYAREMQEEPIVEQRPETTFDARRRRVYKDYPDVEVVNRRRGWSEELAAIIADAYSSRILVTPGRSWITFVGHKSNVAIAEYLYITMLRAAEKMSDKAAKEFRRNHRAEYGVGATPAGYRESWLDGFCLRIAQRLREERAKFETPSTQTALVRVNKEALAVKSYMDKFKKNASSLGGNNNFNRSGYEDGKAAANAMNISSNAVKAGQPNKQLN